jgi:hypothetical protein
MFFRGFMVNKKFVVHNSESVVKIYKDAGGRNARIQD